MITKTVRRTSNNGARRSINANTSVTSGVRNRNVVRNQSPAAIMGASALQKMTPEQRAFTRQLQSNMRKSMSRVTAATNTANIAARPEFMELLPLFVQKLLILDVYGSVAMKSRQQLIPYFKVKTENTKGETAKGTILSSPFVNRQGIDPNLTGRVVKNEAVAGSTLSYIPVLPGSVTLDVTAVAGGAVSRYMDDGSGGFIDDAGAVVAGAAINYASGLITGVAGTIIGTYQYDNETIGPDADGEYGAKMSKIDLQLDEINLIAEAHELACYWSIYAAFAAQQEYGTSIEDLAKDAAFSELTAEINSLGFLKLAQVASRRPQFDWDASPVLSGSVVPSDYLNMFKLKLSQAAAAMYQQTRLTHPNRLIVGSTTGAYIKMINGFQAEGGEDHVGPYKLGKLDEFDVYMDPNYDPNIWVMACKSNDIRRNSALFGEYMPLTATDPLTTANLASQSGFASMYALEVVNPMTIISGKVLGTF